MEAPDKWLYEYCLIRYMPRPERGEFLNVGLLMMCKRQKWIKGKILLDAEKIKSFHKTADIESLEKQTSLFERSDVPQRDLPVEEKYRWLSAEKSACIRTSPSHPALIVTNNETSDSISRNELLLEEEFYRLFDSLVR